MKPTCSQHKNPFWSLVARVTEIMGTTPIQVRRYKLKLHPLACHGESPLDILSVD